MFIVIEEVIEDIRSVHTTFFYEPITMMFALPGTVHDYGHLNTFGIYLLLVWPVTLAQSSQHKCLKPPRLNRVKKPRSYHSNNHITIPLRSIEALNANTTEQSTRYTDSQLTDES